MASLIKILDNAKFLSKTVFGEVSAPATPTYAIGRSLSAVDEGSSITFTLSTTNVANGTVLPYTITGISANDVTSGSLTGSFTVSNNIATATITMSADQLTEGAETATLTLNNAAASNFVVVNDTSTTPVPLTISGLQLWLDAADSSTLFDATAGGNLVTADGAAVARWADKSGNNRHATQGTANARPILKTSIKNGRNGLRFDGSNDFLTCGDVCDLGTNSAYIFIVARNADSTNCSYINKSHAGPLAGRWLINRYQPEGGLQAAIDISNGTVKVPTISDPNASGYRILSNRINRVSGTNTSSISLAINNSTPVTLNFTDPGTNFNTSDQVLIGAYGGSGGSIPPLAGLYLNGDVCETAVYIRSTPLTNAEISSILTYLNAKWALY